MASSIQTPPTVEEIAAEIVKLNDVKPRVRRENIMRGDNHLKIETEIACLSAYPLQEMQMWPEEIEETRKWLVGEFVYAPSVKWKRDAVW